MFYVRQRSHQSKERHKHLKPYELLLIITPDHDENEAEALTDQVKSIIESGGTLLKIDPWGKKRLAYPIQKRSEGYYVLYIFESAPSFVASLNQSLRVIETILRYMIVQYEDDIDKLKAEIAAETEKPAAETTEKASDAQEVSDAQEASDDDNDTETESVDAEEATADTDDEDTTDNDDAEAEEATASA